MTLAIIDADILAYQAAFAAEFRYWVVHGKQFRHKKDALDYCELRDIDPVEARVERDAQELDEALYAARNTVSGWVGTANCTKFRLVFSDDANYRKHLYKSYKDNRNKDTRPIHLLDVQVWLMENYPHSSCHYLEADDVLGIMQTRDTVICSIDKDLLQIPGMHLHRGQHRLMREYESARMFYHQLLTGDTADNIEGIHGIGPKRADKILGRAPNERMMAKAVVQAYRNHYKYNVAWTEHLAKSAMLLWIMRQEKILWPYEMFLRTATPKERQRLEYVIDRDLKKLSLIGLARGTSMKVKSTS